MLAQWGQCSVLPGRIPGYKAFAFESDYYHQTKTIGSVNWTSQKL